MTIDYIILIQMLIFGFLGAFIYLIIGIIPGTDETSVLAPLILILLKIDINPIVVITFFFAGMISLVITDSIPTALTTIPGGVMSTPLVDASKVLKEKGLTTKSLVKMVYGSIIGTIIAFIMALIIIGLFELISEYIDIQTIVSSNSSLIFFIGGILLALLSQGKNNKIISLISIIPFALITGIFKDKFNIPIVSFFLAITTGPLVYSLFRLISKKKRRDELVDHKLDIMIIKEKKVNKNAIFKVVTKDEFKRSSVASALASLTFFLSPVGMTLLIGDLTTNNIKNEEDKAFAKVTVMNAIANASYLSGIMISLIAFKFPISPAALGPAGPLFDSIYGVINKVSNSNILIAVIIGIVISLTLVSFVTIKYAEKMTYFVFKYISHEAVLALLFALIVLIVFLDSGFIGIGLILIIAIISGFLHKKGVSYGVLFMALYASNFILGWF